MSNDPFTLAGKTFNSRLIIGSSQYPNPDVMQRAIEASGAEIATVAVRRVDLEHQSGESILKYLQTDKLTLLPNTAGCFTAKEAVFTAKLAREALGTNWVKLEVIGDEETLFPDIPELLKATEELLMEGFEVFPYCNDDPITCKKLNDMGCAAVMPLGAPIGSGMGIRNPYNLQIIRQQTEVPLIVDAGVGTALDAAEAMEFGCDGVLMNSAISQAEHPVMMAEAMRKSMEAGRLAYRAGRMPRRLYAKASTPMDGMVDMYD